MRLFNKRRLRERRRELRKNLTTAEARLWRYLQRRQLEGRKFRRQFSVGPYVLDFYCPSEKLAIELDGQAHNSEFAQEYDSERTKYLESVGVGVLRFENKCVVKNLDGVLAEIKRWFQK